ncbi:MAG: serine protein kinase RIO [Candidatus Aenigmarchaeota archaeon]|nr:serine protein kinase RIO [Candidatus Aenigmarchaeota archaeon]
MLYKETFKVYEGVLDNASIAALMKFANRGVIDRMKGFVKQGKESSVLVGQDSKGNPVAVKVYAIEASNFKRMAPYLEGDQRFSRMRKDKRTIVYAWCSKEYKNLMKATSAGVLCPRPIDALNNVLIMEFLGEGYTPAPRLMDVELDDPETVMEKIIVNMKKLYGAKLVHGDLSAYNILYWNSEPYIIDFSQGVLLSHPMAEDFLKRDVRNVLKFFGAQDMEEETMKRIRGK